LGNQSDSLSALLARNHSPQPAFAAFGDSILASTTVSNERVLIPSQASAFTNGHQDRKKLFIHSLFNNGFFCPLIVKRK